MQISDRRGESAVALEEPGARFTFPVSAKFATKRLLLVGTGRLAAQAYEEIRDTAKRSLVVGTIDNNPQPGWAGRLPGLPLLGALDEVEPVVMAECIDEIHVAIPFRSCFDGMARLASAGRQLGISVCFHFSLDETPADRMAGRPARAIVRMHDHPAVGGFPRLAKRIVDIAIACLALLALAPVFLVIALLIKLTSAGPVFFEQPRIGLRRRQFPMLKFRTMTKDAEALRDYVKDLNNAQGISFKVFQDPRVTAVGRILRRSSLDELPQLINVLRGEMSLVGPRPIPVWVAEQMRGAAYTRRFSVPQGLTGFWQVEGREQDFDRMAAQDLQYVDSWTFGLDLRILLKTIPAVFRGEGAH